MHQFLFQYLHKTVVKISNSTASHMVMRLRVKSLQKAPGGELKSQFVNTRTNWHATNGRSV